MSIDDGELAWRDAMSNLGILSLSSQPDNLLLWSHYASSHTGFCLRFDPSKAPFELANRVSYEDKRPVFRVLESDRSDLSDRVVLQKATAWAYEEEWRVMKAREVGLVEFVPEALTGIILGAAISERDSGYVQEVLARQRKPVNLMRAEIDRDMYRVRIGEPLRS